MHDLTKGTYWSLMVHGTMFAACLLVSCRMGQPVRESHGIGLALGSGSGGSRPGAKGGGPSGPRDVSDLSRKPAAAAAAAAPPPASVTKASTTRAAATSAGQTSPTGPAVLPAKADTKNETMAQRIERIRRSARPLTPVAATRNTKNAPPAKKLTAKDIAARLNDGIEPANYASNGTGSGGGKGTNPRGRGPGTQDGAIDVGGSGRGGGSGDGEGDGEGGGGGGGNDPFLAAISAALHDAWETPSRAEIGSGDRAVAVKITLRSDGRVTAFQVTRPSGNAALDQSVEQMLRQLRRLPAPAKYGSGAAVKTIDIMFRAV